MYKNPESITAGFNAAFRCKRERYAATGPICDHTRRLCSASASGDDRAPEEVVEEIKAFAQANGVDYKTAKAAVLKEHRAGRETEHAEYSRHVVSERQQDRYSQQEAVERESRHRMQDVVLADRYKLAVAYATKHGVDWETAKRKVGANKVLVDA